MTYRYPFVSWIQFYIQLSLLLSSIFSVTSVVQNCEASSLGNESCSPRPESATTERYNLFEYILAENYQSLDPDVPQTIVEIKKRGGHRCWHKHSTFLGHLLGVHNILRLWSQGQTIGRVGLLHSAYSNSYVNLALFDPNSDEERITVRNLVGSNVEELVYLFCVIDRQHVVVDTLLKQGYIPAEGLDVPHLRKADEIIHLSPEVLRMLVVFTMADISDQYFGWQDRLFGGETEVNSMLLPEDNPLEHESTALWPGLSKPGLWMSYLSKLGAVASTYIPQNNNTVLRDGNEIIKDAPPIFDNCTKTLSRNDEINARDLYWSVVSGSVDPETETLYLKKCVELNPWAFEPRVMLAQKYLHDNLNYEAEIEARQALHLQQIWGTAWDKRMSFPAWVSWTRVLHQRAKKGMGWPSNSWDVNNFGMVNS